MPLCLEACARVTRAHRIANHGWFCKARHAIVFNDQS